jgi:uncharacterized membrane protein YdjX (TVP38/TMEM64 family)
MEEVGTVSPASPRRFLPLAALAAALVAFFALDGERYLSFDALAQNRAWLEAWVARTGPPSLVLYVLVYFIAAALSLPGAAILTMAGGLLFGVVWGTLAALVGATLGASAVFLIARSSLGAFVERHAGARVRTLEAEFRAHAASYLLMLRLVPLFPFWLVNLAAGLLGMRLATFVLCSFFGMAPGAVIYASLGRGLGEIIAAGRAPDLQVVFAPRVLVPLLALAALALVPAFLHRRAKRP